MNHHLRRTKVAAFLALAPVALAALSGAPAIERVTGSSAQQALLSSRVSLPSFDGGVQSTTLPNPDKPQETAEARVVAIADRMKVAVREDGLPLGALTVHPPSAAVPDMGRIAVVLPQKHRAPGSTVASNENDAAVAVQRQLESVITYLAGESEIRHVLVEGETYGPVAADTTERVAAKLDALTSARGALVRTERHLDASAELHSAITAISEALDAAEREAFLSGASYVARAEGAPLELYGLENRATLDASAAVVRDYIYQQDQLQRLERTSVAPQRNGSSLSTAINLTQLHELQQLLQKSAEPDWREGLTMLERAAAAAEGTTLSREVEALRQAFQSLQEISRNEAIAAQRAAADAPGRTDNPYSEVVSTRVLREKMQETEAKIESLILDQRNVETAENFLRLTSDEDVSLAAIQIGARHTGGLTKELQQRGVTVLVLTPSLLAGGAME